MQEEARSAIIADDTGIGALDLFSRWERHNWRIATLDLAADRPGWDALPAVVRDELMTGLRGFFLGEVAVTETLAPIAHAAPRHDYQLYLCTQLADEARHVLFFRRCLDALTDGTQFQAQDLHISGRRSEAFAEVFERQLSETIATVKPGGQRGDWYRAVTVYHLLAEGVLATTVLRSLTEAVQSLRGLDALRQGLSLVTRDEARHAAFGTIALRDGVQTGYGDVISRAIMSSVRSLAWALVDPERRVAGPSLPPLVARHGRLLTQQWEFAARSLRRRLASVGLEHLTDAASEAWRDGCVAAVAEYEQLHGQRHPSRLAHLLPPAGGIDALS